VVELTGIVYSLEMSLVMTRIGAGTATRFALTRGFREAYRQLSVPQWKRRVIAGPVILGKFAAVWYDYIDLGRGYVQKSISESL
jgi:hypothetical protein